MLLLILKTLNCILLKKRSTLFLAVSDLFYSFSASLQSFPNYPMVEGAGWQNDLTVKRILAYLRKISHFLMRTCNYSPLLRKGFYISYANVDVLIVSMQLKLSLHLPFDLYIIKYSIQKGYFYTKKKWPNKLVFHKKFT